MMAPSVGQRAVPTNKDCLDQTNELNGKNSRCSSISDGESYECYGQVDTPYTGSPNSVDGMLRTPNGNILRRNSWLRSSLKRSSNNHENLPNRRWGSFRQTSGKRASNVTSPINRSSSFNSSGRSSACDTTDDVYSDASLEEDVIDLNHKAAKGCEQEDFPFKRELRDDPAPRNNRSNDMFTEEETPSLGHGLEYDLWEGQFVFSGAEDTQTQISSNERTDRSTLSRACTQLNQHVQMLQEQMSVLADNQNNSDERYTRAKQDNATLQARVLMLEEQLREVELRAQEKLQDEERWHREMVARVDREKQLQVENCAIRLQSLELENCSMREEANRCRAQAEKLKLEVTRLEEEQSHCELALNSLKEELEEAKERERASSQAAALNQQLMEELSQELECLRLEHKKLLEELELKGSGVSPIAHEQLKAKFAQLREENQRLQEAYDEIQAQMLTRGVEEGRSLLTGHQSLAAELEAMSQDEPAAVRDEASEAKKALKEQQEVNEKLRNYIDGILLNIVDNHPALLEVKGFRNQQINK